VLFADPTACLAQGTPGGAAANALRTGLDDLTPAERRRAARAQRARTPVSRDRRYGNPPGAGAGQTGFISTNTPPLPPPPASPLDAGDAATSGWAPAVRPISISAAPEARNAAGRPASPRPGATIQPLSPESEIGRRSVWPVEVDPFAPTGFRLGSFLVHPAAEISTGYDSNPGRSSGGRGSWFYMIAPEVLARSDWSRHELSAALRGSYVDYEAVPSANQPSLDARMNGRIDFTRSTWMDVEGRYLLATNNPASPDLPAGLSRLPIYTTLGGTAGLSHRFNRLEFTVKGTADRVTYEPSRLTDGTSVSNRDRDYEQYGAVARVAYELTPGIKPFTEATFDTRMHDLAVDRFGVRRDSDGVTGRIGTTFEISRKLTGEISVGYLTRTYSDPTLPDLNGLIFDGSVLWAATGLTTVRLTAKSTADESTLPGVSGVLRRDGGLQVDHAFRRWLIGTAKLGYGVDLYRGSTREDDRYLASVGIVYKLTRDVQMKGELRREWMKSNVPGASYDANIALVGVRLQR
jgi:hypothetical protein